MTSDQSRALVRSAAALPSVGERENVMQWATIMSQSGFFKDAHSAQQAAVKILYGTELGFSVGAAMSGIHIIEGRPTIGAGLMAAAVKRSEKYDYHVKEHDEQHCIIDFFERRNGKMEPCGTSEFTLDDADQATLLGRAGRMWEKYPRNMVFARAMSNGIAWYCPDVFESGRIYTAEEINPDIETNADGDIIDVQAIAVLPNEGGQQRRAPAAARPGRPAAPASVAPRDGVPAFENAGQFMGWATHYGDEQGYPLNSRRICDILGVTRPSEISDFAVAAGALIAEVGRVLGGPPEEPPPGDAPVEGQFREVDGPQPGNITAEATDLLREHDAELSQPQKVGYLGLINDGVAPEAALTIVTLPEEQRAEYDQMVNEGGMQPADALAVVRGDDDEPPGEPEAQQPEEGAADDDEGDDRGGSSGGDAAGGEEVPPVKPRPIRTRK